jgi:hypothetical protein
MLVAGGCGPVPSAGFRACGGDARGDQRVQRFQVSRAEPAQTRMSFANKLWPHAVSPGLPPWASYVTTVEASEPPMNYSAGHRGRACRRMVCERSAQLVGSLTGGPTTGLQAGLGWEPPGFHGLGQGFVASLVLVGVGGGEVCDRFVEDAAGTPGRRRWRSGRPSVRARGRVWPRTSGRTAWPPAPAGCLPRRSAPSRGTGGGNSHGSARRCRSRAASPGRCHWLPASRAGPPRPAGRDCGAGSCRESAPGPRLGPPWPAGTTGRPGCGPPAGRSSTGSRRYRRRPPCAPCVHSGTARSDGAHARA